MPIITGYACARTVEQAEEQITALRAAGATRFLGGRRDELASFLSKLRDGDDTLMVTTADKLARSVPEFLKLARELAGRQIGLVVLSIGGECLDTREASSKAKVAILAGVEAWEHEIKLDKLAAQREGIARAAAAGRYKGGQPKPELDPQAIRARLEAGESPMQLAKSLGVARSSIYRKLDELGLSRAPQLVRKPKV